MSGWITFVFVILGTIGTPSVSIRNRDVGGAWVGGIAWASWAIVMLGLLLALLVDAKGWP